jgi:hypothetical protein
MWMDMAAQYSGEQYNFVNFLNSYNQTKFTNNVIWKLFSEKQILAMKRVLTSSNVVFNEHA